MVIRIRHDPVLSQDVHSESELSQAVELSLDSASKMLYLNQAGGCTSALTSILQHTASAAKGAECSWMESTFYVKKSFKNMNEWLYKKSKNLLLLPFLKCPLFNNKINKGYGDIFMRKKWSIKNKTYKNGLRNTCTCQTDVFQRLLQSYTKWVIILQLQVLIHMENTPSKNKLSFISFFEKNNSSKFQRE